LQDENNAFGSIGFAPAYSLISNAAKGYISNDGAALGGSLTNYRIFFNLGKFLGFGSWFRVWFPSGFIFGTTSCELANTE